MLHDYFPNIYLMIISTFCVNQSNMSCPYVGCVSDKNLFIIIPASEQQSCKLNQRKKYHSSGWFRQTHNMDQGPWISFPWKSNMCSAASTEVSIRKIFDAKTGAASVSKKCSSTNARSLIKVTKWFTYKCSRRRQGHHSHKVHFLFQSDHQCSWRYYSCQKSLRGELNWPDKHDHFFIKTLCSDLKYTSNETKILPLSQCRRSEVFRKQDHPHRKRYRNILDCRS